ncbi:hypothetical protein QTH97_34790 [Variovorax sp. J22R24]|uniref:hypothetical protein n=1 Tax=Variovorax gracilis TaxID=3053502 RepID=UPI002574DC10|nr:hypothetical protein [Variovorax sp. J22R24]MDM0110110.1 hypothetical protein [Variovorax sp. J22R24]
MLVDSNKPQAWRLMPPDPFTSCAEIRSLKGLEVHQWELDAIALAKQQAYAAHVQLRRPSMTLRIERNRQDLEIVQEQSSRHQKALDQLGTACAAERHEQRFEQRLIKESREGTCLISLDGFDQGLERLDERGMRRRARHPAQVFFHALQRTCAGLLRCPFEQDGNHDQP